MANCNKLFLDFNEDLTLTSTKKARLKTSKDNLRAKIREHFEEKHSDYVPNFFIQGSYKLKTTIRTKEDECDLDDGIYFFREPDVSGTILQDWVKDAVTGVTDTPPEHRKKCIRVIYAGDYHIDLPVYYKLKSTDDSEHPNIAVKSEDFQLSDPKEFVNWFNDQKDENGQLVRIVKYLKAWGDHKRNKMPNGLTMTVLAEDNISYNEREDIALKDTLVSIKTSINDDETGTFECIVPTTPNDDLFEEYDEKRKHNFLNALDSFIEDAKKAISESNQLRASKLWKKHLGDRFPEGADEDVDSKQAQLNVLKTAILSGSAKTNTSGHIQQNSGVPNLPHRNFGGE
jgi:hypothetical protein